MTGWDGQGYYLDSNALRTQQILATGGHAYGPQFGPAEPPEYDDCPCALSGDWEETCEQHGGPEEPEERITEDDVPIGDRDE